MIRKVLIRINSEKEKAERLYKKLEKILDEKNIDYIINSVNYHMLDIDLIFSIGGDGTLVQTIKRYPNIPTIGINAGTLGFLTEINEDNLEENVKFVLDNYNKLFIQNCMMLKCKLVRNGHTIYQETSVNDVVISRNSALEMVRFNLFINGQFIKQYNADGYIISTPLGSSAYSLSCGGPIIDPTSKLIELTPIAAHSLINRSIVTDDSKIIKIEIIDSRNNKENTLLSIDGNCSIHLEIGDEIYIEKSEEITKLVRINNESFVENLSNKMFRI